MSIHQNDKQNQRKNRKMERRAKCDTSFGGAGKLNHNCNWAKRRYSNG